MRAIYRTSSTSRILAHGTSWVDQHPETKRAARRRPICTRFVASRLAVRGVDRAGSSLRVRITRVLRLGVEAIRSCRDLLDVRQAVEIVVVRAVVDPVTVG